MNDEKAGMPLQKKDRPILEYLRNHKVDELKIYSGHFNYKLIAQVIDDLVSGNMVFLETGPRTGYPKCGKGLLGTFLARVFSNIDKALGLIGFKFELKKNPGQDWVFLLIEELDPLIEDYYWDFNKGCYFYPRDLKVR